MTTLSLSFLLPTLLAPSMPGLETPAAQAVGQDSAQPAIEASSQGGPNDVLTLRTEGAEAYLSHPKDRGLLSALRLLDDRLAELPGEIPDFPPLDEASIQLIVDILTGPKSLRIGIDPSKDLSQGEIPFYGRLELHSDNPEGAQNLEARLLAMLQGFGAPEFEVSANGHRTIPVPAPVPVTFGVTGNDMVLDVQSASTAPLPMGDPLLPTGATPLTTVHFDYGAVLDTVIQVMTMQGEAEDARMMSMVLERFGLRDFVLDAACASDGDRSYGVLRMPGWAGAMQERGLMATSALEPSDIALIPADATWASISKMNIEGTFDLVYGFITDMIAAEGQDVDPIAMIQSATQIHVRDDIIAVLGDTIGMYASDTTGGGGMLSTVIFMSLRDSEGALETREQIESMLNGAAQAEADGYVQIRQWSQGEVEYSTLTFPGLPVPIEPTIAISEGWMFVGASPAATVQAVRQSAAGQPHLLDVPTVQTQLAGGIAGIYSLNYQDTARLARDGYGLATLAASALSNVVRSRTDGMREAGPILPSFAHLTSDVKSSVSVGRMDGADWVVESRGDASAVVQLSALCGWLQSNGILFALPAAVAGFAESGGMRNF